ncbi:hypothetical protein [Kitasatospora putterlickiae]
MAIAIGALAGGVAAGQAQQAGDGVAAKSRPVAYLTAEDMNWG